MRTNLRTLVIPKVCEKNRLFQRNVTELQNYVTSIEGRGVIFPESEKNDNKNIWRSTGSQGMFYQRIVDWFEKVGAEDYFNNLSVDQKTVLDQVIEGLLVSFPDFSRLTRTKQLRMAGLTIQAYLKTMRGLE